MLVDRHHPPPEEPHLCSKEPPPQHHATRSKPRKPVLPNAARCHTPPKRGTMRASKARSNGRNQIPVRATPPTPRRHRIVAASTHMHLAATPPLATRSGPRPHALEALLPEKTCMQEEMPRRRCSHAGFARRRKGGRRGKGRGRWARVGARVARWSNTGMRLEWVRFILCIHARFSRRITTVGVASVIWDIWKTHNKVCFYEGVPAGAI